MSNLIKAMMWAAPVGLILCAPCRADLVVNVTQNGGDVDATLSGTVNTTDLTFQFTSPGGASQLDPMAGVAVFGPSTGTFEDVYKGISGPSSFGNGSATFFATSGSGDLVGVTSLAVSLFLPQNYVSGSMLSASDKWSGQTFSSLGMTPGTYTWTWGTGANADSFTMNVGVSSVAVPAPSSLALTGGCLGILAVGALARRRTSRDI